MSEAPAYAGSRAPAGDGPAHAGTHAHTHAQPPMADDSRTSVAVRRVAVSIVGLLLVGAAWLIWVRGEAMIVDLATLGGGIFCF